jgi:uncharacterized protein YlxP (DUF503 family)
VTIGALSIRLFISNAGSLKHKRSVLKSLKERLKNNFNVAVSETDDHDKWQKASLGIVTVGPDRRYVNGLLDNALDFIRKENAMHIIDFDLEVL